MFKPRIKDDHHENPVRQGRIRRRRHRVTARHDAEMTKLLLIGPFVVFTALAGAEAAAAALARWPSSAALWYLNIEVFGFVQRVYYALADIWPVAYAPLLLIGVPLLALAVSGEVAGNRLLVAIPSNLSFVFAGFAVYCNFFPRDVKAASLELVMQPGSYLMLYVVVATALSFAISHMMYLRWLADRSLRGPDAAKHLYAGDRRDRVLRAVLRRFCRPAQLQDQERDGPAACRVIPRLRHRQCNVE